MSININLGVWNSIFAVPSAVVDEKLKFSDGVKLKVLLYILRHSGEEIDENELSRVTGVNVTDIPEAIDYWVSMDILKKQGTSLLPNESTQDNSVKENTALQETTNPEKPEPKPVHISVKPQKPDYVFVAQQLAVDEEFKVLVNEAQTTLGKTLSNSDAATLLMLKNTCGLPVDVIIMLIHYCLSINKSNMRAIETIGVKWSDEGVFSIEAAENKIRQAKQSSKNFAAVSMAFGLKNIGSPTKKQLEYANLWVGEWKYSQNMLREAYERCVDKKGTFDFRYINGILKSWNSNGIHNKEELDKFESSKKKTDYKKTERKTSYNIDELEKINTLDNF